MTSDPTDLDGAALLATIARFNRWATRGADFAHDVVTGRLLSLVDELAPVRISALAAADHTTQPTMTAHVRRLESAGLLAREPDPTDARAVLVRLSPSGATTLAELRAARAAVLLPQLGRLTATERNTLTAAVDVLDRLMTTAAVLGRDSTT